MSIKEAAVKVLRQAGTALHVDEITRRILSAKLWQTSGATPHKSVSSVISKDIQRHGSKSPFVRTKANFFALRDSKGATRTPVATSSKPKQIRLTFADCAEKVLKECGGGKPMHYKEITRIALEKGWKKSNGKTPEETLRSLVNVEIDSQHNNGKQSRFVRYEEGYFGINPEMYSKSTLQTELPDNSNIMKDSKSASSRKSLSFINCAQKVLEEHGVGKLHYRKITKIALEKGWLKTDGKTPQLTMHASITNEIQSSKNRGKLPCFVHHGRGYFGLSQVMEPDLTLKIEQHNQKTRKAMLQRLLTMSPYSFEDLITELFMEMGFNAKTTKNSGDGGIDSEGTLIIGKTIEIKMAIQVKRWKNNVQAPEVRNIRGSLSVQKRGLIITTSDFSKGAIEEAKEPNKPLIDLINGEQLVSLLIDNNIGVERTTHNLFTLDPNFATEPEQ